MKITQEEIVDRQTVLQIELEDEDLDEYLERGYRRVVQQTLIPGFRKGKAPRRIVEQYVGRESLLNEVLDSMLPEVTSRAITQQDLAAAALPRLELETLDPFTFKATVPLTPEVDLGSYKSIRAAQEPVEVADKDTEEYLERLRHNMASWEPVDRAAGIGDMVTMEASGTVEGRTILDEKDAVFVLEEDGDRPFPGFAKRLVGLVKDKPKTFTLPIPDDYPADAISGKEARFTVTVSETKKRVLPDLDDEFAKGVGEGHESLEALRKKVEEELKAGAEAGARREHRDRAVKLLVDGASVELPPLMVEHEVEHLENERARVLDRVNVRMDDYLKSVGKTEEEIRNESRDEAVERLKRTVLLAKLAEVEDVKVSDDEVTEKLEELASEQGDKAEDRQVPDEVRESVRRMLLAEKSVDKLAAIAQGEDPSASESDDKSEDVESADDPPDESADEQPEPDAGGDSDDPQA